MKLINKSNLKKLFKSKKKNSSNGINEILEEIIKNKIDKAVERADKNKRKTVLSHDI